jgi:hypothetical protein
MLLPLSVVVQVPTQTQLVAQAALEAVVRTIQAQETLCLVEQLLVVKVTLVVLVIPRQTKAEVVAVQVQVETTETLVVLVV